MVLYFTSQLCILWLYWEIRQQKENYHRTRYNDNGSHLWKKEEFYKVPSESNFGNGRNYHYMKEFHIVFPHKCSVEAVIAVLEIPSRAAESKSLTPKKTEETRHPDFVIPKSLICLKCYLFFNSGLVRWVWGT